MELESSETPRRGWLRRGVGTLREAIAGTQEDYTSGPLGRAVLLLAVPMVLEMVMEALFAVVDVFFVARLGGAAVATVGLTEAVITLIYAVAVGLAMSTTAMVARRIGEKRKDAAASTAVQAIAVGVGVAAVVAIPGVIYAGRILELMGASPEMVRTGSPFTAIMLGGNGVILLLFLNNAIFRGAGDATIAMRSLWLANGINIVLDPLLIFGWGPFPELGLTGAAVATNIGRGTGVLYQLYHLVQPGRIQITRKHLNLVPATMLRLLRISLGGIGQHLIATASWIVLVRIVSQFGTAAVAGYTIAVRIVIFALLPSWGMSNAAATLVGQNLGAGKPERAERSVWLTGAFNMAFLGLVAILFIAIPAPIISLFTADPELQAIGARCLRTISYGYIFYAWEMVIVQAFNGAGDTTTPTMINFLAFWLCQIPLAYSLAHFAGLRETGVFLAVAISSSLAAFIGLALFRRGKWKLRQV